MIRQAACIAAMGFVAAGWVYWAAAWVCVRRFFAGKDFGAHRMESAPPIGRTAGGDAKGAGGVARDRTEDRGEAAAFYPDVSILKPVKGVDAGAYENFASFCRQDYENYEVLFAVADESDPAAELVRRLSAEFPGLSVRVIVAGKLGVNPKSANLHALAAAATGQVLVISDGDIRVGSDYLRRVVAPLADASVGVVTCPYRGLLPQSIPARLEALHMEVVFLPAVVVAHRMGKRVGMGATLALRAEDLRRAGGFAAIADHLMDDHELTAQIEGLGLRTTLSEYIVCSVLGKTTFRQQWDREVRWARGIRAAGAGQYWGLLATYPTAWAIPLFVMGAGRPWAIAILLFTLVLRWVIAWDVERTIGGRMRDLPWLPLRDVMSFATWCAGLAGNRIRWRGKEFVLRADGRLNEVAKRGSAWQFPLGPLVRRLDHFLRNRQHIFEFCDDADCVLRASPGTCGQAVRLSDGLGLEPGDPVCDLHLYNEHIPPIGDEGPNFAWASLAQQRVRASLVTLAAASRSDPRLASFKALRVRTTFITRNGVRQLKRMADRLHFDLIDSPRPPTLFSRLHTWGENLLLWALISTFNPGGARKMGLVRERHQFFLSRAMLMKWYGG